MNWNHDLFKTPQQASENQHNKGLLVLAVFVKIGSLNEEFEKLSEFLHDIHLKNQHVSVDHLDVNNLLPNNKDYWTYPGSLTTPPCSGIIQIIYFIKKIELKSNKCVQNVFSGNLEKKNIT